jgi:hypothetical protein
VPGILVAVVVVAFLTFLVVRAARSDDSDRWVSLLAQLFFLALAVWVVAEILIQLDFATGRLGLVIRPLYDVAAPASVFAKGAFAAMLFLLAFRAYRRLRV